MTTYICEGKSGKYQLLGVSTGAGGCREEQRAVYRCMESGRLFHRTAMDFKIRMVQVSPAGQSEPVACACGDQYPASSYGAGFIVGSGMCENCDAAIPARDIAATTIPAGYVPVPIELLCKAVRGDPSLGANALILVDAWNAMAEIRAIIRAGAAPVGNIATGQGEAVEVVAWLCGWITDNRGGMHAGLSKTSLEGLRKSQGEDALIITDEPLMTVAQHERIVAAQAAK